MSNDAPGNIRGLTPALLETQVPLADGDWITHHSRLWKQVSPGLFNPPESLECAISQMTAAVTQSTNDNRQAQEEKVAWASEPKLPSEKFSVTIGILQEFLPKDSCCNCSTNGLIVPRDRNSV
jgi:hypothetical protein